MRKFLLVSFLLLSTLANASHIIGGMLAMSHDPNSQPNNQAVALYLYTDVQGILPQTQTVKVYIENNNFYQFSQNLTLNLIYTDTTVDGYLISTYTSAYQQFYMSKYRFIYTHCCWGISNNVQNSFNNDFVLGLDVDRLNAVNNNTPMPTAVIDFSTLPQNFTNIFNLSNYINDNFYEGDSIQYESYDVIGQYSTTGNYVPVYSDTNGYYNVGGAGHTQWTPATTGRYLMGYKLTEWRPGNIKASVCYIQHSFNITPSAITIEEDNINPIIELYDWYGNLVFKGENINWTELNGFYIIKYNNKIEKIFING